MASWSGVSPSESCDKKVGRWNSPLRRAGVGKRGYIPRSFLHSGAKFLTFLFSRQRRYFFSYNSNVCWNFAIDIHAPRGGGRTPKFFKPPGVSKVLDITNFSARAWAGLVGIKKFAWWGPPPRSVKLSRYTQKSDRLWCTKIRGKTLDEITFEKKNTEEIWKNSPLLSRIFFFFPGPRPVKK